MDKTQQRYERFAQLRAAYPDSDFDELMFWIYDEEQESDERAHYEMLDSMDREREEIYA